MTRDVAHDIYLARERLINAKRAYLVAHKAYMTQLAPLKQLEDTRQETYCKMCRAEDAYTTLIKGEIEEAAK